MTKALQVLDEQDRDVAATAPDCGPGCVYCLGPETD
jgi:hypothetical protein